MTERMFFRSAIRITLPEISQGIRSGELRRGCRKMQLEHKLRYLADWTCTIACSSLLFCDTLLFLPLQKLLSSREA